jgi:hypothetical protein
VHFEHLVQINDPANPLLPLLSTEQLWQGLMWRAEDARPFVPGMTGCTILQRSPGALRRRLEFPGATLEDRVTWEAGRWVRFEVEAAASHAGGSLTIGIEEPEPGHLFLRFTYRTTLGGRRPGRALRRLRPFRVPCRRPRHRARHPHPAGRRPGPLSPRAARYPPGGR